ncbi:hypothetical protein BHS07_08640 [Myxococcus xanthus]|nr:hypothetical protein BHS07_08640 [Myxococcus xanthus]QDE95946.1 hypothetical protein BHS05_08770 [Myxococcus xanthus]
MYDTSSCLLSHPRRCQLGTSAEATSSLTQGAQLGARVCTTAPFVFAAVALLLLGVALLAHWLPVPRASRVGVMTVLRSEARSIVS